MIGQLRAALAGISVYQDVMDEPLMREVTGLIDALKDREGERALRCYTRVFFLLRQERRLGLGDWLGDRLRYEVSPWSDAVEHGLEDPALETAARRDIETFLLLAELDCDALLKRMRGLLPEEYGPVLANLPRWTAGASFSAEGLRTGYWANGAGLFARYRAFLWENRALRPVPQPDCVGVEYLLGYQHQREQVLANARSLADGRPVNNVLLYGDSGTGKSETVKSLLTAPGLERLRLIELDKGTLGEMPELIRSLTGLRHKFILFIDDLAFDQDDQTYSALKTILEGGLERRPANVAVYATSNRRTLVRQTFSDRAGDELDISETIHEKTSLADRFGVRVPFLAMNRGEFLDMVERMATLHGIDMEREALRAEASRWELQHPGRTPRVARQFITELLAAR